MSSQVCEDCGKEYKTRSGLWKHQKKFKHGKFNSGKIGEVRDHSATIEDASQASGRPDPLQSLTGEDVPSTSHEPPPSIGEPLPPVEDTPSTDWMDWDFSQADEITDVLPSPFRSIAQSPQMGSSKLSKAQREALEKQNKGILKMGLTFIDHGLTAYGKAVSLDEDFEVRHSEEDKELVATAQYRYLEEKGLFLTNYLSNGAIAASLTGWYVAVPLYRIRKNAKKKLLRGRLLSRLPLIGRFFKPKVEVEPIGQNVEAVADE